VQTANYQAGIYNATGSTYPTSVVSVDTNGKLGADIITNNINTTDSTSSGGSMLKNGTLFLHNSGQACVFVGVGAGNYTGGNTNTAVGYNALPAIISDTGAANVAIGGYALQNCTTGSYNVGIGLSTLFSCITGINNTAVGATALATCTGNNNTALGDQALEFIASGNNNIGIGQGAGSGYNSAESNNIVIGNAGLGGVNESNVIRIGTSQTANYQAGIYGAASSTLGNSVVSIDSNGTLNTASVIVSNINIANSISSGGNLLKNGSTFLINPGTH
jgi:hypothetical protein